MRIAKDKRVHPRSRAYFLTKYKLISTPTDKNTLVLTSTKDISGGGMRLKLNQYIPVSSVIQLYINFPAFPSPIPTLAKIMWIRKIKWKNAYEAGVQFVDMEEPAKKAISDQVRMVIDRRNPRRKSR